VKWWTDTSTYNRKVQLNMLITLDKLGLIDELLTEDYIRLMEYLHE